MCLILGTLYTVGLTAIGLRYGLLVGIFTGIMTFVPVVGSVLGLITASILAIVQDWPNLTLLAMVVGHFCRRPGLGCRLSGPARGRPQSRTAPRRPDILALFVFSYLFGFVGVLVAVPLAAAVGVLVRFALELYLGSHIYKGDGDEAQSTKPESRTPE